MAETHDKRTETHACDLISRKWLMECVNEGWIEFDTQEDENRFVHLIRDIAPSAQQNCDGCKWSDAIGYGECHHCKRAFEDMYEKGEQP